MSCMAKGPLSIVAPFLGGRLFIGGVWRKSVSPSVFPVYNPSSGQVIGECAEACEDDVNSAVDAARSCFDSTSGWSQDAQTRAEVLRKLAAIIKRDAAEVAALETLDMGKPGPEADADMSDAIATLDYYANLAEDLANQKGYPLDVSDQDFSSEVVREPMGVIAAITPWNYPLLMALQKVAPALAAGCCVVLKPSELAPLSCLYLADAAKEAGAPPGALNVITGSASTGSFLSEHRCVDALSFTGSRATGCKVMVAAALSGPKPASLELGGKSAMIVFPDADIESTIDWIMVGGFINCGQVCSSTSRLLLHEDISDDILQRLLLKTREVKLALPGMQGGKVGPIVSAAQLKKVQGFVDRAVAAGAQVLCGGASPKGLDGQSGYFFEPTILTNIAEDSEIWQEEVFGPVLSVRTFKTQQDAVAAANRSRYGLAASVMSSSPETCNAVARALRVGIVWKNCSQPALIEAPWGGYKQSGVGRENGVWGLEEFLEIKQITGPKQLGHSWEWFK